MKIQQKVKKFQGGGQAPAPAQGAPTDATQGQGQDLTQGQDLGLGQDPMSQILQVAAQAVQAKDCQAALAVCQALMQLAQGGAAPENAPQEEPTFARNGAKLVIVR